MVTRLRGETDTVFRRKLTRIKLRCCSDLSIENDRVGNQTCTTIVFRSDDDVTYLRGVLGIYFGVGARKREGG